MQVQKLQTKLLVQDYIAWRLAKAGHSEWFQANKINLHENTDNKFCIAMRHMAFKFEKIYEQKFTSDLEITSFNCKATFAALIAELFELIENEKLSNSFECNWGRVAAIFSFAGALAVKAYEEEDLRIIYVVIDFQIDFLNNDRRMVNWIESQGSWISFMDYFNERCGVLKLENIDLTINSFILNESNDNYLSKFSDDVKSIFYLESLQNQCKSFFGRLSKYTSVAVGSIGMIALGAVIIKKQRLY